MATLSFGACSLRTAGPLSSHASSTLTIHHHACTAVRRHAACCSMQRWLCNATMLLCPCLFSILGKLAITFHFSWCVAIHCLLLLSPMHRPATYRSSRLAMALRCNSALAADCARALTPSRRASPHSK